MKLFEYAIIHHAKRTKKHDDEGTEPQHKVLKVITSVLAKDEREVLLLAAREIPAEYTERLDQIEVAVRPF